MIYYKNARKNRKFNVKSYLIHVWDIPTHLNGFVVLDNIVVVVGEFYILAGKILDNSIKHTLQKVVNKIASKFD